MRIAIFSDYFYPELGGTQDSMEATAKELAKRGHHIDFYVPRYSAKDYAVTNFPANDIESTEGIRIVRLPSLPLPNSPNLQGRIVFPTLWRWWNVKKHRPDIIHTQTFVGVGWEAVICAKMLGVPLIGTQHIPVKAFAPYIPFNVAWAFAYIARYYNHCVCVTAPSMLGIEPLLEHGFRAEYTIIPNPIDGKMFEPSSDKESLKKEFELSSRAFVFAGRLSLDKNVVTIIRALSYVKKRIPDVMLALAGSGSEAESLKLLTQELNLGDNVKFFGALEKSILAKLYQASEIFVTMSEGETQGMALMQAMACGLPIIAVKEALPEYLHGPYGFLLDSFHDHKALAQKIIHLFNHSDERDAYGKAGNAFVQSFSASHIAKEWETLYAKIASEKRKP